MSATSGGRGGRGNYSRGTRGGGRGNGGGRAPGNNMAYGYTAISSVFDSEAITRVEVEERPLRHMKEMLHLYDEPIT
jgi:hypothetical protein